MRIITVNVPVSYLTAIDKLTGQEGLYPSRSELIRVAVREFLINELSTAKAFQKYQSGRIQSQKKQEKIDENMFVQVPITTGNGGTEYKTYRLVRGKLQ
ncbi:ribbon-helix-helix domain-containing protein [Candidatus Harpocratesius sp.]